MIEGTLEIRVALGSGMSVSNSVNRTLLTLFESVLYELSIEVVDNITIKDITVSTYDAPADFIIKTSH